MAGKTPTNERLSADFRLEEYVFYLVAHVDHQYSSGMSHTLARNGISRPMWRCLAALAEQNGASIGELGRMSLIKQSTLSRLLDRMEETGLIRRRPRRGDERITEIYLAPAGRDMLARVLGIAGEVYARAVAGLTARELKELRRLLKRMLDNLGGRP